MAKKRDTLKLNFVRIPDVLLAELPAMPALELALVILPLPVRAGMETDVESFFGRVLDVRCRYIAQGKLAELASAATDTEIACYFFSLSLIEPLGEAGARAYHRAVAGMLTEIGYQFKLPEQFARHQMADEAEIAQYEQLVRYIRQRQLEYMRDDCKSLKAGQRAAADDEQEAVS